MSNRMRRAQVKIAVEFLEKDFCDGCQITGVAMDPASRTIIFYLQDDRFDVVSPGCEAKNHQIIKHSTGETVIKPW